MEVTMPWRLIATAFGWRAAADEDGPMPVLVVWHPRLRRHFSGPGAWRHAVLLSIRAPAAQDATLEKDHRSRSRAMTNPAIRHFRIGAGGDDHDAPR
jgi:hypothetical protein